MIGEDIGGLLYQLPPLEASSPGEGYHPVVGVGYPAPPGGGQYGPKMPPSKAAETNKQIEGIQKGIDASMASHFGIADTTWKQGAVYGLLLVLFLIGVISLLSASGVQSTIQKVKAPFR